MRNLKSFKSKSDNAMSKWYRVRNPAIIIFNFLLISLSKIIPSLSLKRFILRLTGMKIHSNVAIGLGVQFDIFFPNIITLGEGCTIGYNTLILTHEFLKGEYRLGAVVIGKNAMIGVNCTVLAGVKIGNDSIVSACSLVNKDVPDNAFVGGVPAKPLERG